LKIKHLLDVSKALKIKELMRVVDVVMTHFLELVKKLQSHSKATPKPLQKIKPLKIKHLMKFFGVLEFTPKTHPKTHPTPWHDFCMSPARFFYTFSITPKTPKTKTKNQSNH